MTANLSRSTGRDPVLPGIDRAPIPAIVMQHAEEAVHLRLVRSVLVRAPHIRLAHLARHDERLAAQLDGLAVAGSGAAAALRELLSNATAASVFVATRHAIESRDADRLRSLLALAPLAPANQRGLLSAFGWVSPASLRGITQPLLASDDPGRRGIGLGACAMHRVDPGEALSAGLGDLSVDAAGLRACAARAAAALGRVELSHACATAAGLHDIADPADRLAAARSGLLLGDRSGCVAVLHALANGPDPTRESALALLLKIVSPDESQALLKALGKEPAATRTLLRAIGVSADPHYVPWLVSRMHDVHLARLAGEAFSLITGLDLEAMHLDRPAPEDADVGPSDDPNDDDVAMDEDDGLPWPDQDKVASWWNANGSGFGRGARSFMGRPPSTAHCLSVLQTGSQRQRRHAAEYLCLLAPGTPLFNIAAPAWRQKRLLTQMAGS